MKNKPNPLHTALALVPATALALLMAPPTAISVQAAPKGRIILAQGMPAPAGREEMRERIRRTGETEQQRDHKGSARRPAAQQQQQQQQPSAEPQKGRSADAPKGGASDRTPAATGRAGPAKREERTAPGPDRGRKLGVGQGETPAVKRPAPPATQPQKAEPQQFRQRPRAEPEQPPRPTLRQVQPEQREQRPARPQTPAMRTRPTTPPAAETPTRPGTPRAVEETQPGTMEQKVIEERRQRRKQREAETPGRQPAQQRTAPGTPPRRAPAQAIEQKEIEKLAPATKETVRREGGAEIRSQTFRTDDGRRIEKRIRTRDNGNKIITTRTTTRDGRTVERERIIDRASDNEVERMVVTLGRLLGDRDERFRDPRYRDRWYSDRNRRHWERDRQRDFNLRIVIRAPIGMRLPLYRYVVESYYAPPELIYDTLTADPVVHIDRRYSVDDVLRSERIRNWMPRVDLDTITFRTNEAGIADSQLNRLDRIAEAMQRAIDRNHDEIFLIEGHTDAPGSFAYNLELSEARALSVKYALMDGYGIPERNLVTEGYGEEFLKVATDGAERLNRRVTVRRITPLVAGR